MCESITEDQVVDELAQNSNGHEFVGIYIDFTNKTVTIFHTRELNEEDILHELLHVRFNSWCEEKVNFWTDLLLKSPKSLFQF